MRRRNRPPTRRWTKRSRIRAQRRTFILRIGNQLKLNQMHLCKQNNGRDPYNCGMERRHLICAMSLCKQFHQQPRKLLDNATFHIYWTTQGHNLRLISRLTIPLFNDSHCIISLCRFVTDFLNPKNSGDNKIEGLTLAFR